MSTINLSTVCTDPIDETTDISRGYGKTIIFDWKGSCLLFFRTQPCKIFAFDESETDIAPPLQKSLTHIHVGPVAILRTNMTPSLIVASECSLFHKSLSKMVI